jgi:MFS family permease
MPEEAPGSDRVGPVREGRVDPRALWTLLVGNGLTSMGVSFFLPILPLYLASRGASSLVVGVVFAAGITGRALVQYPAGWLSDRYGRRPLLVLGLLVYAAIFPVYLLSLPPLALVAVRFLHALAGGTVNITAIALMADLTESEGLGKAFGWLRASDMAGVLLGPALGGLVAGFRLDAVFIGAALVCLRRLPDGRAGRRGLRSAPGGCSGCCCRSSFWARQSTGSSAPTTRYGASTSRAAAPAPFWSGSPSPPTRCPSFS